MPHSKQAEKRVRQTEKRRLHNRTQKKRIKTFKKRFIQSVEDGDKNKAQADLSEVQALLDRAAKTRLYHPNKIGRDKARLQKRLNTLG